MQHVTPSNDNMSSDEDRILDDKGYNPLDTYGDIDKDTERKLLDRDNDNLDLVGNPNAKPNNRKWKTSQPDDVVRPKSKLFKKILGLARKKTDGASNFGKKSKLPKFKNLAKSVLMKEAPTEATYSSSSKSDDTDSSLDDNDNSVLSNDETIAPKRFSTIHEEEENDETSEVEMPKYKLHRREITKQECHPLTGEKYIPKEQDNFFSGQFEFSLYFQ